MPRVDQARRRLEQALSRLERAASTIERRAADRDALAHALEEARAEGQALRDASATVSQRLDGVIGRLRTALGA